jgi:hypothetical protein
MEGRAMLTEDPMKGVRKEAAVVTSRVIFLFSSQAFPIMGISFIHRTRGKIRHFAPQ